MVGVQRWFQLLNNVLKTVITFDSALMLSLMLLHIKGSKPSGPLEIRV